MEPKSIKAAKLRKLGEKETSFHHWKEVILSFIGKKHLRVYVLRDVRNPTYIREPTLSPLSKTKDTEDETVSEEEIIKNGKEIEEFKKSETKIYTPDSIDTPMLLLKLSLNSTVVSTSGKKIFQLFRNRKKCIEAKLIYALNCEEVKTILRATVTMDLMHYIAEDKNTFESFNSLVEHF
eukprot:snap_masked-scaffold_29-processed-gene-1.48-mRNA-1 protein AED:1.00 eAED:1.00 QI:0/-1/0/0/-1/1/1/0/178